VCGDWSLKVRPGQTDYEVWYWATSGARQAQREAALLPFAGLLILLLAFGSPAALFWIWGVGLAVALVVAYARWPNESRFRQLRALSFVGCALVGLAALVVLVCDAESFSGLVARLMLVALILSPAVIYVRLRRRP